MDNVCGNIKFKVGDVISDGFSQVTVESVQEDSYIVTSEEIESDAHIVNWVIYFKDQDKWKLVKIDKDRKEENLPDKIYATPNFDRRWQTKAIDGESVEYTRTDAFIEKACEWLTKHARKYYFNKEKYLGTEELVEDFKIVMEL